MARELAASSHDVVAHIRRRHLRITPSEELPAPWGVKVKKPKGQDLSGRKIQPRQARVLWRHRSQGLRTDRASEKDTVQS